MELPVFIVLACLALVTFGKSAPRLMIDREHLKFDFLNIFGTWTEIFSDAEMDFRYFAAHDVDNNKKLDGLELYTALEHDATHEAEAHDGEIPSNEDLEREVESIFSEHDKDEDGFLDFKEYLKVQKTHPDINREKAKKHREL